MAERGKGSVTIRDAGREGGDRALRPARLLAQKGRRRVPRQKGDGTMEFNRLGAVRAAAMADGADAAARGDA